MSNTTDEFGNRMKQYEAQETERHFIPQLPVYARLDGRSFHTFTRGFKRPFDEDFSSVMVEVTKYLVEETHAIIGYTQSDEISLAWPDHCFFEGRTFKMTSVLAGMASAKFNQLAVKYWPEKVQKMVPHFDARVYALPSEDELANCFLWREQDATKNAISMAAQAKYSPKELHGKHGNEMQEMLFAKGVNFNDYPAWAKRGTYVRREVFQAELDEETRMRIPEKHRPVVGHLVTRSEVRVYPLPKLGSISNRPGVLFKREEPHVADLAANMEQIRVEGQATGELAEIAGLV